MTTIDTGKRRWASKNPDVLREDLLSGLTVALGADLAGHATEVDSIVAGLESFDDSQEALPEVLRRFGPGIFGGVSRHQIATKPSLLGPSETLTRRGALPMPATVSATSAGRRTSSTRTTGRTRTARCSTSTASTSTCPHDTMSFHIALTGHRPHLLGGHDMSAPYYLRLRETLERAITGALDAYEHVTLHSGLALGADTVWSHAILTQTAVQPDRVAFVSEVPFPGQAFAVRLGGRDLGIRTSGECACRDRSHPRARRY